MIFIDASFYIAVLNPQDKLHKRALTLSATILSEESQVITSYGVLGEVLTVGSMRYNRQAAIDFVTSVLNSEIKIILEDQKLLEAALAVFKKINDKDVGWVDCYSFAIIEEYKVEKVLSFDKDFKMHAKAKVLE